MAAGITTLMTLPPEMVGEIIFLTGMRDLGHLAQTCTRMRGIANAFKQTAAFTARKAELQQQHEQVRIAQSIVASHKQELVESASVEHVVTMSLKQCQSSPQERINDVSPIDELAAKLQIAVLGRKEKGQQYFQTMKSLENKTQILAEIGNRPFNRTLILKPI